MEQSDIEEIVDRIALAWVAVVSDEEREVAVTLVREWLEEHEQDQ